MIEGRKVGTHFAWHVLNALALFLLLRASLEGGPAAVTRAAIAPPLDAVAASGAKAPVETAPAEDVPAPKKLAERIAPASEEAAKEDEAPKRRASARRSSRLRERSTLLG